MDMLSFAAGFMTAVLFWFVHAVGKAAAMREFRARLRTEEGVPVERPS